MSALPPKADIRQCELNVRFVPLAEVGPKSPRRFPPLWPVEEQSARFVLCDQLSKDEARGR
jgi:hypothetical protein